MPVVLITGGCGFIGSWLARVLLQEDYQVVLFDVNTESRIVKDITDKAVIVKGSITDSSKIVDTLKQYRPDFIVHYAALLSAEAERNPENGYEINISSTWRLFKSALEHGAEGIIFASSIAAYGPAGDRIVSESDYIPPSTLYGVSKIYGEIIGTWMSRRYGIGFAALRYASVIGPGRRDGGASAYTTLVIQKPAQGEGYEIPAPRDARVPIVYVKDAVDATLYVMRMLNKIGDGAVFNVAGPQPTPSAEELVNTVKSIIPDARVVFNPADTVSKIVRSWPRDVDTSRIRNIGWSPKYGDLKKLVRDFIDEVKAKPDLFNI